VHRLGREHRPGDSRQDPHRRDALSEFAPLAGVRVVDVTTSYAGPFCTEVLGALGAEVIKIEPPGTGDEARSWGPPSFEGTSTMFLTANANKRSVAIHLRRGAEIVRRLAAGADIFVQSLRPGLVEELALDAPTLRTGNDRLVYCSLTGFGTRGPLAGRLGYDPLAQAAGGIVSVTGPADGPAVRAGISLVDQTTGIWAALAILAALTRRAETGEGALIDLSLYETAVSFMGYHLAGFAASGVVPGRYGTAFPSIAPYQTFATSDGDLMIAAGNDRAFRALAGVVGLPELAADPRFATNELRISGRDELAGAIARPLALEPRGHWLDRLAAANVPAAPVQDVGEVASDPQTGALGLLPELGGLPIARLPFSVDGAAATHRSAAPLLGSDTEVVLRGVGYSQSEIDELGAAGVVQLGRR
jgi:crotonobetainyl-CoA:carnitine CoA-transferase CaiB-like acyl-CoA transferase